MPDKIHYTPQQEKFIIENFLTMTTRDIAKALNITACAVRKVAYAAGLKKLELEFWTPLQVEFLEFVFAFVGDLELAEYFERHWPKNKPWTKKHIEKKRDYLGLKRTPAQLSAIKVRNILAGRFAMCSANAWKIRGVMPVGTVVIWRRADRVGKEFAVVKTEKGFVHRNPWLWEKHFGAIPDGFVVYADPLAPTVCDVSALSLKTRAEMARIVADSDVTILKKSMRIRDEAEIAEYIEKYPHVIEMKRAQIKIDGKLRQLKKNAGKPQGPTV